MHVPLDLAHHYHAPLFVLVPYFLYVLYQVLSSPPQAWQASKARQDKQLDSIERGLETLRGLGEAMGDNLQGQEVLVNDVQDKVRLVSQRGTRRQKHGDGHCRCC